MRLQVKHTLTKTTEYKENIRNETGYCTQVVGDGYCLIQFDNIYKHTKHGKKNLLWYVHENDFFIKL